MGTNQRVLPDADLDLESAVRCIVQRFHPRRVVLFGSRARGTTRRESDTDLFIEMETPLGRWQRSREVRRALGALANRMDIFVYTPDEVRRLQGDDSTLLAEIERTGVTLYEAGESPALAG